MVGAEPLNLICDLGASQARLSLCRGAHVDSAYTKRLRNAEFPSFAELLQAYCQEITVPIAAACVAVAGPARDGVARLSAFGWEIDPELVCTATGAQRGFVISDIQACSYALDHVDCSTFLGSPALGRNTQLIVGVGSGIRTAAVHRTAKALHISTSEIGQMSLPVWDASSLSFAKSVAQEQGFASIEDVLSGQGISRVLSSIEGLEGDTTDILQRAAREPESPEAEIIGQVTGVFGKVVGDLALVHQALGGVFLIGGVVRALWPWLSGQEFQRGYLEKGRFSQMMQDIPVSVMEDEDATLTGCAVYMAHAMQRDTVSERVSASGVRVSEIPRDHFDMLRDLERLLAELGEHFRKINDPGRLTNDIRYVRASAESLRTFIDGFETADSVEVPTDLPQGFRDRLLTIDLKKVEGLSTIAHKIADIIAKLF